MVKIVYVILYGIFSINIFSSVIQSSPTSCNPMDCSTPGLPVHHQLLELTQTHVHWVGDAIQPSHPLSSPSPPIFNLSQHQGFFQRVSSSHQVAKVLEFQLQHQSFNEYGLISFWNDWFDLLADQGDHILWFYQFVKERERDQFGPEAGKNIQQGTGSERKRWVEFSCVMLDVKRSSDREPEQRWSWWQCSWCMKRSKPTAIPVTKRTLRGLPGTLSFWRTYWITVFDAHFLCCFIVVKKTSNQMEDAN